MRRRALLLSFVVLLLVVPVSARALPTASPEEVGLSRERLARIGQALPGPWQREFRELFRQLVYQAIVD